MQVALADVWLYIEVGGCHPWPLGDTTLNLLPCWDSESYPKPQPFVRLRTLNNIGLYSLPRPRFSSLPTSCERVSSPEAGTPPWKSRLWDLGSSMVASVVAMTENLTSSNTFAYCSRKDVVHYGEEVLVAETQGSWLHCTQETEQAESMARNTWKAQR